MTQRTFDSPAFFELRRNSRRGYRFAKRALDISVVVLLLPVLIPLIGALALILRMRNDKAFFTQYRLGRDGREFPMWKLRTMVLNADAVLQAHLQANPAARKEWDENQKLANDPRITPLGHFLRKYSLDELPQFFNVLVGHMSLVGPRPMFASQSRSYPTIAYYDMKPGITGLWQVSTRNDSTFMQRAMLDTAYANTASFWTDIRILVKTALVVFKGTGL